jgi:predicted site-specific integrase-resolvase
MDTNKRKGERSTLAAVAYSGNGQKARAIGYIRVSTDEQAREGISLENQRAKTEAYCQLNDFDLAEILEDAGKSGVEGHGIYPLGAT